MPDLADPPIAASKWLDLLNSILQRGLLPVVLLFLAMWYFNGQQQQLRADLKEAQAEVRRSNDRCLAAITEKTQAVKEVVKQVSADVRETKSAVQAQTLPPAPAPPSP